MKTVLNYWGIHINNLTMDYHVNQLCRKASKKLYALARIAKNTEINKQRMLMKAFESSQFSYCLLLWMFHSRKLESRINSIPMRALKLIYQNSHDLTVHELLAKNKSDSVHEKKNFSYYQLKYLNLKLEFCLKWWMISSILWKELII